MYNSNSYKVTVKRGRRDKMTPEEVESAIGGSMSGITSVLHLSDRDGTDKLYHKDEIVTMVSAMFGAWHEGRISHNVSMETAAMRAIAQGLAEREASQLSRQVTRLQHECATLEEKLAYLHAYTCRCINTMQEAANVLTQRGWGAKKRALALLNGVGTPTS